MLHQLYWVFLGEKIFYSIFTNLALLLALSVVVSRNPIYSILSLIGVFIIGSFLMILVGAEFLAFVYIVVYVGAIAVLFLFIIMMINVKSVPLKNNYNSNIFFLAVVPFIVITFFWQEYTQLESLIIETAATPKVVYGRIYRSLDQFFLENPKVKDIVEATTFISYGVTSFSKHIASFHKDFGGLEALRIAREAPYSFMQFYITYNYFYLFKVTATNKMLILNPSFNIEAIGYTLYVYYFFPFILCGMVLLIAMMGAIVITKYQRTDTKRQEISSQILTYHTVRNIKIPFF